MSMEETVLKKISERKEFNKWFKVYIANKDIPLEERWRVYCLAVDGGIFISKSIWIITLKTIGEWPENKFQRYESVFLNSIVEGYEDEIDLHPHINLDELKEEILQTGYSHFIYDW